MEPPPLETVNLWKKFSGKVAVAGSSIKVPEGKIVGLIGTNGAGKSTTLKMLMGLLEPDKGQAFVFGENALCLSPETRRRVGYLSELPFEFDTVPLPELIKLKSTFFPNWDWDYTNELMDKFSPPLTTPLVHLSYGERRKCELILVLVQKPDLLILDDPALGLDVTVRRTFLWAALEVAREEGKTVVFSSHNMTDVERIVDSIIIMKNGIVLESGDLEEIQSRMKRVVLPSNYSTPLEEHTMPGLMHKSRMLDKEFLVLNNFTDSWWKTFRQSHPQASIENMNLEDVFCEVVAENENPPIENADTD